MSKLDEIVEQLESCRDDRDTAHDYLLWEKDQRDLIDLAIALLRAGQKLWDACARDDMDHNSTLRIDHAMKAWETALKGDEG